MNRRRKKRLIKKKVHKISHLDFPFLIDRTTVSYLKKNKVVFILRGLPGSGKSYIAKQLLECYLSSSIVCSADFYFTKHDGTYNHDIEKFKDAHQYCKETYFKAIIIDKKHIIVDNMNIQTWEIEFYIQTANKYNYIVLIVEPRTPWKLDVEKLEKINQHGYVIEYIESRKCLFKPIAPYFWGFFVNEYYSFQLSKLAERHFKECCSLFMMFVNDLKCDEYQKLYNIDLKKMLHCTTYYEGNDNSEREHDFSYSTNPYVIDSLGKYFRMSIQGFIFTTRTTGVTLRLSKNCLKMWKSEDAFIYKLNKDGILVPSACDSEENMTIWADEIALNSETHSLSISSNFNSESLDNVALNMSVTKIEKRNIKKIQMKKGARAHFTIGCCNQVEPVQTGFDVLSLKYKYKHVDYVNIIHQNDCSYIYYGDGECEVLLDWPMHVDSLFACYYL